MGIEVVDHDPAWAGRFAALRDRYEAALVAAGVPWVAIEHVGSTAVAGLAAKPVVDIDIVVAAEHVEAAGATLAGIGFQPLGDLGVPDRWAFRPPPDAPRTNTYVVVEGCLALRNHLGVRDVLRGDPDLRAAYGEVKRRLAASTDDIEDYVEGKSAVLSEILAAAGIGPDERASIEHLNRRTRG